MDFGIDWSEESCKQWVYYQVVMLEIITVVVECILIVRRTCTTFDVLPHHSFVYCTRMAVYALYGRNKIILATMSVAFAAEFAMMVAALVMSNRGVVVLAHSCLVVHAPSIYTSYW